MSRDVTPIPKATERLPKNKHRTEYAEASGQVEDRSRGACEAHLDGCPGRASQVHHRGGRGWDGCNTPTLLMAVCGAGNASGCHGHIHQRPGWARRHGFLTVRGDRNPMPPVHCPLDCETDHQ